MSNKDTGSEDWRRRDRKVLWHPFTQHMLWNNEDFPIIERGEGIYLYDVEGKKYLDGVSSLWLNLHGHGRPEIDRAIQDQLGRMAHSTFLGLSHPPGIELAEKLIEMAPDGLTRVFFSDDGSTAMEIALKMAYQYWRQVDPDLPDDLHFIKFANAYHGDTIGSVSLGGIDLFHATYRPLLFPTIVVHAPYCYRCHLPETRRDYMEAPSFSLGEKRPQIITKADCVNGSGCLAELEGILAGGSYDLTGVVIEPMVQGAAGILIQPDGFLYGVRELCDQYGLLMIVDEVATGFGRTGTMFACNWEEVKPDIMAVGKGLSGGYLPVAATLTTEEIFEAFQGPHHSVNTFFHGHSYTANPLGCAAALASLDIFKREKVLDNVEARAKQAAGWYQKFFKLDHVGDFRQLGLMIGIEIEKDPHAQEPYDPELMMGRRVCLRAREKGLILRPLGDVVVIMPPLCVTEEELDSIMEITLESIKEVTQ